MYHCYIHSWSSHEDGCPKCPSTYTSSGTSADKPDSILTGVAYFKCSQCNHVITVNGECFKCERDDLQREYETLFSQFLKIRIALTGDINSTDHLADKIEELKAEIRETKIIAFNRSAELRKENEHMFSEVIKWINTVSKAQENSIELLKQNSLMRDALEKHHKEWSHNGFCSAECAFICRALSKALAEVDKESK